MPTKKCRRARRSSPATRGSQRLGTSKQRARMKQAEAEAKAEAEGEAKAETIGESRGRGRGQGRGQLGKGPARPSPAEAGERRAGTSGTHARACAAGAAGQAARVVNPAAGRMNKRRGRMIRLKPETRISYRCSPSERRAKTTDPGHAPCRQTRQQRRLLGNRPTVPGFFDFDPTWELFPSSKPPPRPTEGKERGLRPPALTGV